MKKLLSILVTLLLIIASSPLVFAGSTESDNNSYIIPVTVINSPFELESSMLRGTNLPKQTVSLYNGVSYSGTATYAVAVFTNYKFSDHGGAINIDFTNSNDMGYMTATMTIKICHTNFWGQVVDDQETFLAHGSYSHTFSGLSTNTSYYFQFTQPYQTYVTTTNFVITGSN